MLLLFLPSLQLIERKADKQGGDDDIDHVPHCTAEVDFYERLKKEGQRGEDDCEGDFLFVVVLHGDDGEDHHCGEADESVSSVRKRKQTNKEYGSEAKIEIFHHVKWE